MQKKKLKRIKRQIHNAVLKALSTYAVILAVLAACAVDSQSWVPMIVLVSSMAWIALFTRVNRDLLEREWGD